MSLQNMQTHIYFKCIILLCIIHFQNAIDFKSFTSLLNLIVLSHEYIEFLTSFEFQNEKKL
jgi:hypothetical protein